MQHSFRASKFRVHRSIILNNSKIKRNVLYSLFVYSIGIVAGGLLFFYYPFAIQKHWTLLFKNSVSQIQMHTIKNVPLDYTDWILWLFLWLFGQIRGGIYFVNLFIWIKGIGTGLYMSFWIAGFGLQGAGMDLLAILPSNILTVGGIILMVGALSVLSHGRSESPQRADRMRSLALYHVVMVLALIGLLTAASAEWGLLLRAGSWIGLR